MVRVLITGHAGFIGSQLALAYLEQGHDVLGIDGMTDYYDVSLKRARLDLLAPFPGFRHVEASMEDAARLRLEVAAFRPDLVLHLAAQAGVRYCLENPDAYVSSNLVGTFNLLEACKGASPAHVMLASTSSAYGGNRELPFRELDPTRAPVSLYAATKIGTEAIAHSFAHIQGVPVTVFRFFTVYGPWGRPDMALFKFVAAALADEPIEVYGFGNMRRDFTYVDDLVRAVLALAERAPQIGRPVSERDSLSAVAPYRIVNIAGGNSIQLMEFVEAIEAALGREVRKQLLPMQPGDVVETAADPGLLHDLISEVPCTSVVEGVARFVDWYEQYHQLARPHRAA
jgi:UDP-glucuronate 4-epimerase